MISGMSPLVPRPAYDLYRWRLWTRVRTGPMPKHLAVILDGNRRFVEEHHLGSLRDGYAAGARRVRDVLVWSERAGIRAVTLWAMSIDNLGRPEAQIEAMSGVIAGELDAVVPSAMRRGWRLRGIGRRDLLPVELQKTLSRIETETAANTELTVQFALGYGGREEIVDGLRRWAGEEGVSGRPVEEALWSLQPETLTPFLYGGDLPDPDLILRTSGELRLSGFLLWQSVYSEFYFTDVLWPEFREIDFLRALRSYQARRRRFGR
jgi:short-chain Z-isoprenyl diphosphate synthase